MFALIENGIVLRYPYSFRELQKEYPNTSFPPNDETAYEAFGMYRIYNSTPPSYDTRIEKLEENTPTFDQDTNRWTNSWKVVKLTAEEIAAIDSAKANEVRQQRNELLAKTDWRFRVDMNPSQEWRDYCQALRDIPLQQGFPWDVQWPVEPI